MGATTAIMTGTISHCGCTQQRQSTSTPAAIYTRPAKRCVAFRFSVSFSVHGILMPDGVVLAVLGHVIAHNDQHDADQQQHRKAEIDRMTEGIGIDEA